jgi:hypothetical protein
MIEPTKTTPSDELPKYCETCGRRMAMGGEVASLPHAPLCWARGICEDCHDEAAPLDDD